MTFILAIVGMLLVICEVITISTYFIWIAIGFLAASLASIITTNIIIIATVGILATLLSVGLLKTKYVKYVLPKKRVETAFNELVGKYAIMQENYVSNGVDTGLAKVQGVEWSCQCEEINTHFDKGERVKIIKIEGVRLIIEREE